MKILTRLLIITPVLLFSGCNPDVLLGGLISSPRCTVDSVQEIDAVPYEHPTKFVIMVTNSGDATAYNVYCSIRLKKNNIFIASRTCSFGSLNPGESARDEAWFSEITSKSDYQSYVTKLTWYDDDGKYYEK